MVIVANKQEIQAYYDSEDLGQSALKKLLGDISDFGKTEDSTKEHFIIGKAVDCLLTGNAEDFEQDYYVSQIEKKPSEAIVNILNLVHTNLLEDYAEYLSVVDPIEFKGDHFEVTQDSIEAEPQSTFVEFVGTLQNWGTYILEACSNVDWNRTWGAEAKIKNIVVWEDYFLDLCKSFGKQILDINQYNNVMSIVNSLKTNIRTKRFFDRDIFEQLDNVTVYYQFPIYFEYRGVKCKALLDIVIVVRDLEGKILSVQGIDLKTMNGNTYHFLGSLKTRRYDIQAAWYSLALMDHFALWNTDVLEPFLFVVESTSYQGKPLSFRVSESLLELGRYGRKELKLVDTDFFKSPGTDPMGEVVLVREILGFEQLLDIFIYHNENGWSEERLLQEQPLEEPLLLTWEKTLGTN